MIRVIPVRRATKLYECFECGRNFYTNAKMRSCVACGEEDNFYLMD